MMEKLMYILMAMYFASATVAHFLRFDDDSHPGGGIRDFDLGAGLAIAAVY